MLRIQNDELSGKLRRAEVLHARVSEELTKYRLSEGKTPLINFDEEQRLRTEVQVSFSNQIMTYLIGLVYVDKVLSFVIVCHF